MRTVRFKRAFKYSPDGKSTAIAKAGDVVELSDELAASAVKSGAGVVVDLEAEKAAHEAEETEKAEKAAAEEVELDLMPEGPRGDGKTGPVEDKSMAPSEDKADSEE